MASTVRGKGVVHISAKQFSLPSKFPLHCLSLTEKDDVLYIFIEKVLCRTKLFSWDGRYVKQPHLDEVLSSLFRLENHSSRPFPRNVLSQLKACRHRYPRSYPEGMAKTSAVCYRESCIFKND